MPGLPHSAATRVAAIRTLALVGAAGAGTTSLTNAVLAGLVSNLIILGIVLALVMIFRRLRG